MDGMVVVRCDVISVPSTTELGFGFVGDRGSTFLRGVVAGDNGFLSIWKSRINLLHITLVLVSRSCFLVLR